MKEHFKPFGVGWYIIYLIIFFVTMIMTALSYWDIFTDRQIGYVWSLILPICILEGILGIKEEYNDDAN